MTYPPPPESGDQHPPQSDPTSGQPPLPDPYQPPDQSPYQAPGQYQQPPPYQPQGQYFPPSGYDPSDPYGYGQAQASRNNPMAIAAMASSISGAVLGFCCPPLALAALVGAILGHVGLHQIGESGDRGSGMALTGIIVGWLFFVVHATLFILRVTGVIYFNLPSGRY